MEILLTNLCAERATARRLTISTFPARLVQAYPRNHWSLTRKTKSIKRYRLGKLRKQKRKRTFSEQFQFRFIGYKFTRRFFTAPGPLSPFHKVMKNVEFSTKTTLENRMQTTESAIIDEQGMLWFPPDGEDPLQTIKNRSHNRPEDEENSHNLS